MEKPLLKETDIHIPPYNMCSDNVKELTPKQINEIDTISAEKSAIKKTMEVALNYHNNSMIEILQKEREWWRDILILHKLDDEKVWRINKRGQITERSEEERKSCK